jgi:hypothetical protein
MVFFAYRWDLAESSKFDASFRKLRKAEVFSAHDMTISMFLGALQLFPPQLPSYASTVMVELRRKSVPDVDDDPYFVKVLFSMTPSTQSNLSGY